MVKKGHYYKLRKELGLFQVTLYGVGIILGAGIYALLGIGAGVAGNAIWLSFVLGAFMAFFTGLSYAELSSMYPKTAAEYVYTKHAFNKNYLAFAVQWIMVIAVIISGSTVALGFAGYFQHAFGGEIITIAAGLIILLSIVNYIGMKESSEFNIVSMVIESGGLIIAIIVGAIFVMFFPHQPIDYFALPSTGLMGIISGTALIFFAYLGFEEIVNVSEETKKAKKVVPKALVIALAVSTVLYILVSLSAVTVLGWEKLSASKAPMTDVVSVVIPEASFIYNIIALFATANTVLVILIVGSRMLYGLSRQNLMPESFSLVAKRGTPYVSILIVMIASILVLFLGGIKTVALLTDAGLFIVYLFINASVIALRYRKPKAKREFRSPLSVGKMPMLPVLGIISSIAILFFFERELLLYEAVLVVAGFALYKYFTRKKKLNEKKNR